MNYQHRIPIHLEQEDKFIFSLTGRQTLIVGVGIAFGYALSSYCDFSTVGGFLLGSCLFLLTVVLSIVIAFVHYHHRGLEQWALVALIYLAQPRYYIRGRLVEEIDQSEESDRALQIQEESEEW